MTHQSSQQGRKDNKLRQDNMAYRNNIETTRAVPHRLGKTAYAMLTALLCFNLTACTSLPDTPHIAESLRLNDLLKQHYDSLASGEKATSETSPSDLHNDTSSDNDSSDSSSNSASDQASSLLHERHRALSYAIAEQKRAHPNLSGYYPIVTGASAFASRSILSDMASQSIDVQYYIWHDDEAGQLLLRDLWEAAERGVIVRLLLDDFNNNAKLDKHLRRLANHPNVAVRLINPMRYRKFQALNYVTELKRINRRMHNKSMTFDRQISIIGGRNIGNEYLSNDKNSQFADLDVLLIGEVVDDITGSFESYWNSSLSYDIETLVAAETEPKAFVASLDKINTLTDTQSDGIDTDADGHSMSHGKTAKYDEEGNIEVDTSVYKRAIIESNIDSKLIEKQLPFRWAPMKFLSDDVNKLTNSASSDTHLVHRLRALLGTPTEKLTIISSYFVPTKDGVDTLIKLADQGVNVKILTNSFKATDVAAVHAGYAEWRIPLLKAGIELYELKTTATGEARENKLWKARSQSSTSLHAKAFAVDDHTFFIGSYNVDPRSANINTEMGVMINDDEPVSYVHNAVSDNLLNIAYKVVLSEQDNLQWQTFNDDGDLVTHDEEPDVDFGDTIWLKIMSHLPIDWLL